MTSHKLVLDFADNILLDLWYASYWRDKGLCGIVENKQLCVDQSEGFRDSAATGAIYARRLKYTYFLNGPIVSFDYRGIVIEASKPLVEYLNERKDKFQHPKDEVETSSYEI